MPVVIDIASLCPARVVLFGFRFLGSDIVLCSYRVPNPNQIFLFHPSAGIILFRFLCFSVLTFQLCTHYTEFDSRYRYLLTKGARGTPIHFSIPSVFGSVEGLSPSTCIQTRCRDFHQNVRFKDKPICWSIHHCSSGHAWWSACWVDIVVIMPCGSLLIAAKQLFQASMSTWKRGNVGGCQCHVYCGYHIRFRSS